MHFLPPQNCMCARLAYSLCIFPKLQDIDDDKRTVAELTVDQQDESASLEVGHQLDDQNRISPKIKSVY